MTTPPLADVPVRTAAELTARWTALLDPPVFGARSLWLAWLDDAGLMLPVIVPVDDVPLVPDRRLLQSLLTLHGAVAGEHLPAGGHLALVLCRPGARSVRGDDDEWVDALRELLDGRIDQHWSLHLAAEGRVTALVEPPAEAWPR